MPEQVWVAAKRQALRALVLSGLRVSVIAAIAIAVGVVALDMLDPYIPMAPPHFKRLFIGVGAVYAAMWWVLPAALLLQKRPPLRSLSRSKLSPDSDKGWRLNRCVAFDLQPSSESATETEVRLFKADGRQRVIVLPGDDRDGIIVRIIARSVPPLETHADRDRLVVGQTDPPTWVKLLLIVVGLGWGLAVSYALVRWGNKDLASIGLLAYIVSPVWLVVRMLRSNAREGAYNTTIGGWAFASCLLSFIVGTPLVVAMRDW